MSEITPALGGCVPMGLALVNMGPRGIHKVDDQFCPTCDATTRCVIIHDGVMYGWHLYCTVCLDGWWSEGCRMERPFARYWRRDRKAKIDALIATALAPEEYDKWVRLEIHRLTCEAEDCAQCSGGIS